MWAVMALLGRTMRVAAVHATQIAAMQDRRWREQQVHDYRDILKRSGQPTPLYSVAPIRRTDLPRGWRPLPALGFLRDKFR